MSDPIFHRDPEILGGTPVFYGTRVPVEILLEFIEAGDTIDEFLDGFPSVSREQVVAFINQTKARLFEPVA